MANKKYTTKEELAAFYQEKVDTLTAEIRQLKKNNMTYIASELMTFGLAIVAVVVYCVKDDSSQWLMAALAMLAVYAVVRRADVKNGRRIDKRARLRTVYEKEKKYVSGDFTCFSGGSRYKDPQHAFTFDMDVFGHESLYNRIDRTVTTGGGDMLAQWLGSLLPGKAEVASRREAVDELAGMEQWRTEYMAAGLRPDSSLDGKAEKTDSGEILRAVSEVGGMDIAPKAGLPWTLAAAVAAMACFFALIVGSLREFWVQFRPLILQLRYSADVTVALDIMGVANTVIGFASTVAMLLLPIVTRKLNKNVIIIVFSSLSLVVCGALGFVGIENIPQGTVSAVVLTLLFFIAQCNPTYLLIPVMLGEIADWQQARTGKRYEGHLQNFIFTIPGVFSQVAMLASWLWQNAIGFEPAQISNDISEAVGKIAEGAAIDPTTIVSAETHALANEWFNACFLLTAGSIVLMIILLCFYPLTRKKHAELIAELESKATNLDELDENESVLAEDGSLVLKRTLTEGGEGGDEIAEAELPEATPIPETPDEAGGDAPEKLADGAPPEAGSDLPSEDGPETK